MPVYIDRDTFSKWNADAIDQQATLTKESIAAAPPLPSTEAPSPAPAQPAFQPPTPSDTLTQPVPRVTPGPPALGDLLAAAGLAESPSPSAGGAASGGMTGAASAPSGGIPSLDSLFQSAGLGDVGGAVGGAAQTVASAAPPPLADLMRSAGLLDQPKPAQPQPAETQPQAPSTPQPGGAQFGNEVNQFQLGLSDADAYAFCGPAAAIAFSRQYGRNPTAAEARQLAVTVGWSPDQGMAGIDSERALLSKMGVATRMESNGRTDAPAFSWDHVTQDAMNGNPVVLDTPGHYYYVDGARTDNGQVVYHVGQSGLELRGGREWMTAGEINAMSQSKGSVRGALYADNPQTPHPSVANTVGQAVSGAAQAGAAAALGASKQVSDMIDQAAQAGGVAPALLAAVVKQESGFSQTNADGRTKTSPAGALGLAQLMPDTARGLGVDPHDAMQNLIGGARYLKQLLDQFGGDVTKTIAAYNAGPGAVQRYGGTPPYDETQNYVRIVSDNLTRAQQAAGGTVASAAGAVQGAAQSTFADLAQSGGNLAQQGAALAQGLTQPAGESPTAPIEREANQRLSALQDTLNTTLQGGQQAQDQRSVQASTIGGGLAGRGAVNVTDAGGGLTPEQIAGGQTMAQAEPEKPLWAKIGDTIGSAISQGLQPLMQAIQGTPVPEGGGYGAAGPLQPGEAGQALAPIGQAATDLAQSSFMPTNLTNTALQAVGQNVVAPALEAAAQPGGLLAGPRAAAAGALEGVAANVPDNVPVVAGALRNVAGMVGAPTILESAQTVSDLEQKYGGGIGPDGKFRAADYRNITPEDQEALHNAIMAVGGVTLPPTPEGGGYGAVPARGTQEGNFLRSPTIVPSSDPRPATAGGQPGLPNVKAVMQQHLAEVLPSDAVLYHETSLSNARAILQRVEAGPRNQSGIWTSDNRDLALGQGGKGVMLEFDPARVNGGAGENPAKAFSAQAGIGTEYQVDKTLRGAVRAIVVNTQRQADQLAADPVIASRFDFSAAQQTPEGIRIPYAGPERATGIEASRAGTGPAIAVPAGGESPNQIAGFFQGTPGAMGESILHADVQRLQAQMDAARAKFPEMTDAEAAATPLGQQIESARQQLAQRSGAPPAAPETMPTTLHRFGLSDRPVEGQVPLSDDDLLSHFTDLQTRYEANDVQIARLEDQLHEARNPGVAPIRPQWAVGLPNESLIRIANDHGVSPYQEDWWEQAGLSQGSQEVSRLLREGGYRGVGTRAFGGSQLQNAQAELDRLKAENQGIMDHVEQITAADSGTLYRAPAQPAELPFAAPTNAVEPSAGAPAVSADIERAQAAPVSPTETVAGGRAIAETSPAGATAGAEAPRAGAGPAATVGGDRLLEDALKAAPTSDAATAARDASRDFDLQKLADLRAQYQANEPRLLDAASKPPSWLDRVIGVQAANMLSGVGTGIQNVLGNLGAMAARPATTAGAGYGRDAIRDVAAMGSTLGDAFAAYGRTFKTGQRAGQRYETSLPSGVFAPLSVPLRNLAATDEFFRTLNSAGAAAAEASRRLRENPTLSFDQVLQKHADDIVKAAADGAARAVYEKGGGAIGKLGNWLAQQRVHLLNSEDPSLRAVGLGLQWLVPMSRVPAVILGEGIRSLPVINEATGAVQFIRAARAGDSYAARQAVGRTWLTSAANLAIYNQVLAGSITGDGPTNPEEKARLMEAVDQDGNAVWRPNSARLPGGRWLDYSGLGPIALQMSTIANLSDQAKDEAQKPPEKRADMPHQAMDMLGRTVQTIGNAWYLRTLSDVLGAIKDGNVSKVGSMIGAVGDRFIPAEALLNEIRRIQDPLARQPGNLAERELNRVPFASQVVPPRIASTTGQPLEQPRDVLSTLVRGTPGGMMRPNPVASEIARLDDTGNRVSVPSPSAQYAGAQQTPAQQRLIQEQIGQATDLYVLHTMQDPKYAGLTDVQKADALNKAHAQARDAANITLSGQVARSPHESALMQWAQVPQYAGVSSRLPPEQIARANWEIEQARSKLSDYRKQYGEQAENRLRRDDPTAYRLSQRDRIDKEVLDRKKKAIDKATGGAFSQTADTAASGGLVGVGGTVLRP